MIRSKNSNGLCFFQDGRMANLTKTTLLTSTGRTGTMFFRDYLTKTCPNSLCLHEPSPSRVFKLFSNMIQSGLITGRVPGRYFLRTRNKLSNGCETYFESNNFVFGCIGAISSCMDEVKIIHLVRDPITYAESHIGHGFWKGHKKFFAKHVPFWIEKIGHPLEDPYEVLFLRWAYVNRVIASAERTNPYMRVRFEDIFTGDSDRASGIVNEIRSFLGFEAMEHDVNKRWLRTPKNASTRNKNISYLIGKYSEFMNKNIRASMDIFGYTL